MNTSIKLNINRTNSLRILAILAFGLMLLPGIANAQRLGGYVVTGGDSYEPTFGPSYDYTQSAPVYYPPTTVYVPTYIPVPEPVPVYVAPVPVTPTVYSNSTNPNPPRVVTKAKPKPKTTTKTETNSDLTANAVFGDNGFLPSGLIQWILFAILVLLIVIMVRRIYGGTEKYHATPLKHD